MITRLFFFVFTFILLTAEAQTTIEVLDNEKKGMPSAHIIYSGLSTTKEKMNMVLTDNKGIAIIPLDFTKENPVFIISISYLGFKSIVKDTVKADSKLRFVLQEDEYSLDEFVVTAQYAPSSPDKSVYKISIINSEKIEAMAAVNLTDALSNQLNMRISQDNILGSQVSMQGLGGENVKILIDGVPMIGRTDGNIDLNQINLDNIERIEVVEGPMSVNYGTNALAGAINLITKKGSTQKWDAGIQAYTESIGKYNLTGSLNYRKGPNNIGLSGGRNYFDGWNPGDKPYSNDDPIADSTRFQQWKPKLQYLANFQYGYQLRSWNFRLKSDYFNEKITSKGLPRPPYHISAFDDYFYTFRFDNSIFANGSISENFKGNFIAAYNQYERIKNTYVTDLTTINQTLSENPDNQDTSKFDQWTFRGSVSNVNPNTKINYEVGYDINLEEGVGKRILDGKQSQNDFALYASAEYKPWINTVIRPGLRIAYNTSYQGPLIPSINIKQDIRKFSLRGSYALGFRAPSIKEQYFEFVDSNHNIVGNPNLKPENSNNFNVSAKYTSIFKNTLFKAELSGFYNSIENLITLANTSGTVYSYVNIDRFKTTGISGGIQMDLHHFKISLGASYIGRYNEFSDQVAQSVYNWTTEGQFNLSYEFKSIGLTTALFIKYQGALPSYAIGADDQVEELFVDAYTWSDFTIAKNLWKNQINLSTGIKNLFNIESVNSSVSSSSSGGVHTGGGSLPVGMGRSFFISLKYNFISKN